MLMFVGGWESGLSFIAFHHQITVLSRELIQEAQPVLPIKGGRTHETECNCQGEQKPFALAQGQMREGEVSLGVETWYGAGKARGKRDLTYDQILAVGGGHKGCHL